jgi:hypothetical protein
MVSITLSVPEELKAEMDAHPEMNWSEVARQAIRSKIAILKRMDALVAASELTEKDALAIGRKVNRSLTRRTGG